MRFKLGENTARLDAAAFKQVKVQFETDGRLSLLEQALRAEQHFVLVPFDVDLQQIRLQPTLFDLLIDRRHVHLYRSALPVGRVDANIAPRIQSRRVTARLRAHRATPQIEP